MLLNKPKCHSLLTLLKEETRDHDLVIDTQHCRICHTDIHEMRDEWGASTFPIVAGHQFSRVLTGIGPK